MSESNEFITASDPLLVPSQVAWEAMSKAEQDRVEEQIITALERESQLMGETTLHFKTRAASAEIISRFFKSQGQKAFVASDLHTLYPDEQAFYPDLMVVFDVENHERSSWNAMREGKGLDFVLEVLSKETKRKDRVQKLNLYARIEIPEYFMYDPERKKLSGFTLKSGTYQEIQNKDDHIRSEVLGLQLVLDEGMLRFASLDGVPLPFAGDLVFELNQKLGDSEQLNQDYARQLEKEKERRVAEEARAAEAEQKFKEAEAEILKLRAQLEESKTP